jgi:hypothetical protein
MSPAYCDAEIDLKREVFEPRRRCLALRTAVHTNHRILHRLANIRYGVCAHRDQLATLLKTPAGLGGPFACGA